MRWFGILNFRFLVLPFDYAQGGELVETFRILARPSIAMAGRASCFEFNGSVKLLFNT